MFVPGLFVSVSCSIDVPGRPFLGEDRSGEWRVEVVGLGERERDTGRS